MHLSTPGTVWRFLLGEVLRLLVITAAIVVVVTAFAGSIRFFANGTLNAVETLSIAGLLMIPMLQFALPFAGGFASTLAYHRMSQDNELTACYAGGVSHRSMLFPAVMLGLVGAAVLFLMADQMMPRFLRKAQEMISTDPTKLLTSKLAGGQSLALDNGHQLLYADDVREVDLPANSPAFKHLVLRGVVAVRTDARRDISQEMSSRVADVWLYRGDSETMNVTSNDRWNLPASAGGTAGANVTWLVMQLRDPVGGKTNSAIGELDETTIKYQLPSTFNDDPKYLSWSQLEQAKAKPEILNIIDRPRRRLAQTLAERVAVDQLRRELTLTQLTTFVDSSRRPVTLRAAGIADVPGPLGFELKPIRAGGTIDAIVTLAGGGSSGDGVKTRTHRAARAYLAQALPGDGQPQTGTTLSLVMENVSSTGESVSADAGVLTTLTLPGLSLASDPLAGLLAKHLDSLTNDANTRLTQRPDDRALREHLDKLTRGIADLRLEIASKQHERIATALACGVMIVLGAVMGMRLGVASPLVVYLWSFLPALGALISISAGQSVMHQSGLLGIPLIYGGVGALAVYTYLEYRALARH